LASAYSTELRAAYAATRLFTSALNRADELGDLASSLGITATQLQSLQAAVTVAGVEAGTLNRGFISIGEALSELQARTDGAVSDGDLCTR
jgi:DNA-binding Xre family transcriptional regulator